MTKQEYWDLRYRFYRESVPQVQAKEMADVDVTLAILSGRIDEKIHKILDYNVKDYSCLGLTGEELTALRYKDELIFTISPAANKLPV